MDFAFFQKQLKLRRIVDMVRLWGR